MMTNLYKWCIKHAILHFIIKYFNLKWPKSLYLAILIYSFWVSYYPNCLQPHWYTCLPTVNYAQSETIHYHKSMYCFRHWFLPLNLIHKFEVDTNTTIIMTMVDVAILRHTQWWRESCEEKWEMRKNQEKCKSWKELIVGVVDHNLWCHKATEKWQNWPTSYSKPYIGHNMNGMINR